MSKYGKQPEEEVKMAHLINEEYDESYEPTITTRDEFLDYLVSRTKSFITETKTIPPFISMLAVKRLDTGDLSMIPCMFAERDASGDTISGMDINDPRVKEKIGRQLRKLANEGMEAPPSNAKSHEEWVGRFGNSNTPIFAIGTISDSWMVTLHKDVDMASIPSPSKAENRKEAVVIAVEDRTGMSSSTFLPYKRKGDDVFLIPEEESSIRSQFSPAYEQGRLCGLFREIAQ